ncbi:unnamed protein product [Strongylus vulgaris]|uniref:Uncharacterized protein n=1 Tax=Strongylus vulgaris TaxID=40348 RepID=A0A3P7L722_STRVU|nr:unnamed protein product [Strongylus vulgaris]
MKCPAEEMPRPSKQHQGRTPAGYRAEAFNMPSNCHDAIEENAPRPSAERHIRNTQQIKLDRVPRPCSSTHSFKVFVQSLYINGIHHK